MGKIWVFVLGLAVVGGSAYLYLNRSAVKTAEGRSEPARMLDNVRSKAKDIEQQSAASAQELMKKTQE